MKIENQQIEVKDETTAPSSSSAGLQVEEKRRRAWEQWSADDIAAFFEGLNEFGKDFDAIQNCLSTRNKKKSLVNATNIKNKDQVRHFYYRTWHKISKYLSLPPDEGNKRVHKELYGLINYGEMWKKLGGYFNDRCGEKLNELVQLGVTSVKIKGKSHRIKTPVCPALKRLQQTPTGGTASGVNGGESSSKIPALPEKIVMELTPGCNADFLRVQSVAHNPRIRICTDSSSPLSNVIAFLTKKWKPRSIADAETAAEDELIMRVTPDARIQALPVINIQPNSSKKSRKRTFSGQEPMDESDAIKSELPVESKAEPGSGIKSWILDTADVVTVGEVYTVCGGVDGRLPLTYTWERRSKAEQESPDPSSFNAVSLLRALVSVAKSSLTKSQTGGIGAGREQGGNVQENLPGGKKTRRQIIPSQLTDANSVFSFEPGSTTALISSSQSPLSEASPTQALPIESPVQYSRMRQRMRRPLRYGSSLKRGSLATTLNKMPGPLSSIGGMNVVRPSSSMQPPSASNGQPTTMVNITWPPEEDGNGTGSFVLQVRLDGQPQQDPSQPSSQSGDSPPTTLDKQTGQQYLPRDEDLDSDFFAPPSVLLHTPVKNAGSIGWGTSSTASSLPSTPHRLQEWMSILMPNTPEKTGLAVPESSASVKSLSSIPFSIPDSLNGFLSENGILTSTSSQHSGEGGSGWPNRDGDEMSLSSLLNQLVSPAKSTASSRYTDFKLPFDLQSLAADNSVDLTAKFAELAASIAAADANGVSKNRP